MNDNDTWQRATFVVPCGDVEANRAHFAKTVTGLTRGPFGVFCCDFNGVNRGRHNRVSITHLPTGRLIAHTDSGATALRIGDALMDLAGEFLRPMTGPHTKQLGLKVRDIVHAYSARLGGEAA